MTLSLRTPAFSDLWAKRRLFLILLTAIIASFKKIAKFSQIDDCLCGVYLYTVCIPLTLQNVTVDEIKQKVKKQEQQQGTITLTRKTVSGTEKRRKQLTIVSLRFQQTRSRRDGITNDKRQLQIKLPRDLDCRFHLTLFF